MKKILFLLVALVATFFVKAGQHPDSYLRTHPVWMDMMKDPKVNFYEALHAFELYWEGRPLPIGEHELMNSPEAEKESGQVVQRKKQQPEEQAQYAFAYRQFKRWVLKNEAFVKEDGSLYSAEERVELWKQQQQNRK